jgi:hypothetical protein
LSPAAHRRSEGGSAAAAILLFGCYVGGKLVYHGGLGIDPAILKPGLRSRIEANDSPPAGPTDPVMAMNVAKPAEHCGVGFINREYHRPSTRWSRSLPRLRRVELELPRVHEPVSVFREDPGTGTRVATGRRPCRDMT